MHHDNAPADTSMLMLEYSPDLAPADVFLFPKLRTPVKGQHFAAIEEIKVKSLTGAVGDTIKRISEVFRGLEKVLAKCIISEGGWLL